MNTEFSVEVPAEANPLTEGILFHVLRSASSADQTQVQTGTKQLQQWEKTQGFYPLLQVWNPPHTPKKRRKQVSYKDANTSTGPQTHL
jgi:hypothetical protein